MPNRSLIALAVSGLALSAAGCAMSTSDGAPRGYTAELERLRADCEARQGILTPRAGGHTGQPQTDYICEIRGPATRLRD